MAAENAERKQPPHAGGKAESDTIPQGAPRSAAASPRSFVGKGRGASKAALGFLAVLAFLAVLFFIFA